jgi:protein deglycase
MKKVIVPLADGFEEIEAITIIDVLRRGSIEVTTISVTGNLEIAGAHHIKVKADKLFGDCNFVVYDMIVLPGGMPGSMHLNQHEGLKLILREMKKQDKYIAAICAAPLVLGTLGMLEGLHATCYPGFEKYLLNAMHSEEGVVTDGKIITGKGAGFAMPFALKLLELLTDKDTAGDIGRKMLCV